MTLASKNFDSRLRRLEAIRDTFEHSQPLLVTVEGAEEFYGDFLIETPDGETIINRAPGELWEAFEARLNQLAFEQQRSPLSIIFFFPTTTDQEAEN